MPRQAISAGEKFGQCQTVVGRFRHARPGADCGQQFEAGSLGAAEHRHLARPGAGMGGDQRVVWRDILAQLRQVQKLDQR